MDHILNTQDKKNTAEARVMVFFLNDSAKKHFYFSHFSKPDQAYILSCEKKIKKDFGACEKITLPESGTTLVFFGLGEKSAWTLRKLALAARKLTAAVRSSRITTVSVCLDDFAVPQSTLEKCAEIFVTNAHMAKYEFNKYKKEPKEGWPLIAKIYYDTRQKARMKSVAGALATGAVIGRAVNATRDLSNTPGCDMTPRNLASAARGAMKGLPVKITILGEAAMKKLGMNAILAVSQGSKEEAQFIIMEYSGGTKTKKPLAFIGKGITFDSGGLHIKPWNAMDDMFMDMSGGAAVIGAMKAIAQLKLKENVVGIVPAVENMPSGESFRPGDIITAMSGITIEVGSPDAEGRVILADALTYAERYKPRFVVDVATLTGACSVALGNHASAVLSPDDALSAVVQQAGERSGDYLWPLPLWEEYEGDVKGVNADLNNGGRGKGAGTTNGAMFLKNFAKNFAQWVHIDIASTMTSIPEQALSKGAAGSGTRLLIELARSLK